MITGARVTILLFAGTSTRILWLKEIHADQPPNLPHDPLRCGQLPGLPSTLGARDQTTSAAEPPRRKIAFLGTVVRTHSHSQHFLDRLAMGYGWGGSWQEPRLEIASVFIDQFPEKGDLARQRVKKYGLKLYPDIENALTLGTGKLAVDGVVIIAEHGDYPGNAKGQKLYPRYDWFKKCVKVFEASGRSVPVFNDKHLSTDWKECVEMVEDAKRLKKRASKNDGHKIEEYLSSVRNVEKQIDSTLNPPAREWIPPTTP